MEVGMAHHMFDLYMLGTDLSTSVHILGAFTKAVSGLTKQNIIQYIVYTALTASTNDNGS